MRGRRGGLAKTQNINSIMNRYVTFCCLIAVLTVSPTVQSLSVVGPQVLRPFSTYSVAVAGGSRAHTLYVAVEGKRSNGEQFTQGREVQIPAASSRLIELEIGDPGPGLYALVARSTSGPLFSSSAPLAYQPRSFCVFVQTDKRVYQPGDTINFRVIALDKYLLPVSGAVDVTVLDSGGSPIRQWAGVPLEKGVLTEELVLADEPALGEWTIQVETRGQTYSRGILVADYVLPKFQMDMKIPKEMLFSEGRFTINITAKHFNGLPVRGELTISAYPVFFSGVLQPVISSPVRKVVDINGNAEVLYDLKTDLDLAEDAARPLVVEAVLEEKDTLITQNISSRILLLRAPYRLKVTAPDYFKPTLPYVVQIEVVDPSGQIIDTDGNVTVERLWDDGAPVNVTMAALKHGLATYTITPVAAHVNSTLNLVIKYKEVTERVENVQRNDYSGGNFLTLEMMSKDTTAGDEMRARLSATEPMDLVHYVVIGRGDILIAKTMELSPPRRSVDISIQVTSRMAPGCVLLAWYPRLDATRNTLLSTAVYVPQKNLLQHKISISPVVGTGANPKPNTLVELRVTGEPGSQVALLGEDVAAALNSAIISRSFFSFKKTEHDDLANAIWLPPQLTHLNCFVSQLNAGVVVLTDGVLMQNSNSESSTQAPLQTGTRPPLAGPYAFSRLPPPPSPRYYLTVNSHPTWTLANFTIGADGRGSKERWTPVTPGEYSIGAFAVHPTLGLGLATPQKFTTSVPLTITAEIPTTLQRGETLATVIILSTTLAVDTSVEVTFYNSDQYFEFEPLDNDVDSSKKIELFRRVRVTVPARGSASTAFLVTAVRTGAAPVIVEAAGNGLSDSLFRTIDVKDGYEEELWSWDLLDARKGVARANVTLDVAPGIRVGAISLVAAGDLLAGALKASRAPPAPAADPPHAIRPLALACVLLDYLQATGQQEESITKEARTLAALGYQRLMAYRKSDGSFAPDTDSDSEGDVWMTAVSGRWLSRCAKYLEVTPVAANGAIRWLADKQNADGGWQSPAVGARNDPRAQAPMPLAAYVLIALFQAKGADILYKNNINKATDYLAKGLDPSLDAFTLAIVSAALTAAKHSQGVLALQMMDKYANTTGSTLFWSRQLSGSEWRNPWLKGNNLEASTAAHALRTMLANRLLDEATPVVRSLLQAYRPFDPDPEVVDALAQFAETIKTSTKLRVSVNVTGSDEARQFQIGENNAFIIQTQSVRSSRSANAVTEGRGIGVVGLSAVGSTNVTAPWPRYTLDPRVDQVSTKDRLQLSICFGRLADINTLTELTSVPHVVSARLQRGGSRVVSWVWAGRSERCATLAAPRAQPTARQRPGWTTLEDLYDSSHRARVFFQPIASTACDVCREWESCSKACGSAALQRAPDQTTTTNPNSAATPFTSITITAIITVITWLIKNA
ncbi:hypothetical protein K1T71_002579 [Dendrolimus kikuchii]|uniref:Uncharacterized protein n=1 Tax=Dendrolimus kikuchii TaxID=765133 RepID=A0ACC1DE44_9NEOP|nr:hypothetical protein K1T71_002579 [Dendrolimus kikuchii]